jgi:membrane-bound lytic murein transglycosylase D
MGFRKAHFLLPIAIALLSPGVLAQTRSAPPQQLHPQGDPIQDLLQRSEREYQRGEQNYAAGHLEAAKEAFDQAVTILLESPYELRSNERLLNQFERIVDAVHRLELAALKEGDGFSQQRTEPAPIDEVSDVTFPVDPNVRAKAEAEARETRSELPLMMNDIVAGYVTHFSGKGLGTVQRALTRGGRYRDMIVRIFREEGVPEDLIYLAVAESGFRPLAVSRASARGMWQFMSGTGKVYGLQKNWWVDDRQDPEKATRAAARHLKDLFNQFGDWYLAMAAYNSGAGNVQRAVQRTGYADFWELYRRDVLPRETKNYVPIIVAITLIAKNPDRYGLSDLVPDPPLETDVVTLNYPVDLRLAAECADTTVDTLQELNPSLLRMTTPKDSAFDLRIPAGAKETFLANINAIPRDKRVLWRYHKVAPGETLSAVARKYRISSGAIAQVNNLEADDIRPDERLIIPVSGRGGDPVRYAKKPTRYKVRRGDTVSSVAEEFGVPPEKVRRWNGIRGNKLVAGRTLRIYPPIGGSDPEPVRRAANGAAPAPAGKGTTHRIRPGDTLYSIARTYNTTVAELKRANGLNSNALRAGDTLVVRSR